MRIKKPTKVPPASQSRTYDWPRPAVTVDLVIFGVRGTLQNLRLQVLLIQRDLEPFRDSWALPGGFVREGEDLYSAALRELEEETGIREVYLEQVAAIGTPGRDPRGHTVTVVYMALVSATSHAVAASGDARAVAWFDLSSSSPLPPLAFDHAEILARALEHLRQRLGQTPVCFQLLPEEFTLSELQALCEAILGRPLDRRNFRRRVLELEFLAPTGQSRREGAHRPAQLFRFIPSAFDNHAMRQRGVPF